jgi:predicted DNA-binding transcriptional regulator AlpA
MTAMPASTTRDEPSIGGRVLLSLGELAEALSLGERSIRRWVEIGQFPEPIRAGNRVRWRARDVIDWMDRRQGVA